MHIHSFDNYVARASPVHARDPRVKVLLSLGFILTMVLLPDGSWTAFVLSWAALLGAARLAQLPGAYLPARSLIALPFALAAVTVLFTLPGEPVLAVKLGSWTLTISDAGLLRFASILLRSWLAVQAAVLLTAVTEFPDFVHALQHLRVPQLLTAILSFMYRYLFVLADEAMRLLRARASRSGRRGDARARSSIPWRAHVAGCMVGQLFLRSYERSDRVYQAMLARGYQGRLLTMNPHQMSRTDWLALAAGLSVLLFLQLLARS